ncbi:RND transporter [Pseudoalteromonas porphyrae]|uniref:RND transporter n=2 Tax=Pseudoalteromonas TaxID=53246 RepID=A0A0N1MUR2_9GAMM|nr:MULTISPECIES: HlyD family efflux transporter periplasmic adaptor subunit [Pseudoalteromonas]KPH63793.1 RND transporter [Pseudoalteromonas porphyrae]KPH96459.1 RND transporter [Pseudoalteromonas porphyrae]
MDIIRKKQKAANKKPYIIAGICLVLVMVIWQISRSNVSNIIATKDTLLIDTVKRGQFEVTVRGIGVLVPKDIRWVATNISGRVEAIYAKAGASVKVDDILMVLSNPELEQQLEESQWELEEMKAQLHAQKIALESQVFDQEALVINSQLNYERALLTLNAQESLIAQDIVAVSKIAHEEVKIDVNQFKQRWLLEQKRLLKSRENMQAQIKAFSARSKRMQHIVSRMQSQVDGLTVKATIDSIVQEMPLELGQRVNAGTNLARLAKSGEFLAELRVPEKQVSHVALGQHVTIDTRANITTGIVKRIDPAVINGSVQVDVELVGDIPKEARPELSVDGIIEIAKLDDVLFVKRPMFAKANSTGTIYALDTANEYAQSTTVEFGQMSATHIEIKQGLATGNNIVVSDVSAWDGHQQIKIN